MIARLSQQSIYSCVYLFITFLPGFKKKSNLESPRCVRTPIVHIWLPVISGFPKAKIILKRKRFHTISTVKENTRQLMAVPKEDCRLFRKWKRWWYMCVKFEGVVLKKNKTTLLQHGIYLLILNSRIFSMKTLYYAKFNLNYCLNRTNLYQF